jgi:hypothetical protein
MAITSRSHPLPPSPSKAMPSRKRKSPVKRNSPPKKTQKSDKATSQARKTLPTKSNRKHPPPETSPTQHDRKDPPENIMPTLMPVAEVVPCYSFRTNRTPAPSPPRVLRLLPINPYHPFDHTSDAHLDPSLELLTHAAAAVVDKRGKSADECSITSFRSRQSNEEQIVGQKGSPGVDAYNISDDDDYNSSVGTDTDDRSSNNKAYEKTTADDLYYSDDDFLDEDFYREIDDLERTIEYSDPKKVKCGRRQKTLIKSGPQPPDYSGMTKAEKDMAKDAFEKKRKSWTDKLHRSHLKKKVSLDSIRVDNYMGCLHPTLRRMAEVERHRLRVGHTFPDIDILKLHVAEEVNLRGITFYSPRSKVCQLRCYGKKFAVKANNNEHTQGFLVSVCSVREGDDFATLNLDKYNNVKEREQTPFKTVMIVPLIIRIVAKNLAVTNKTLRGFLNSYGREYALTE